MVNVRGLLHDLSLDRKGGWTEVLQGTIQVRCSVSEPWELLAQAFPPQRHDSDENRYYDIDPSYPFGYANDSRSQTDYGESDAEKSYLIQPLPLDDLLCLLHDYHLLNAKIHSKQGDRQPP